MSTMRVLHVIEGMSLGGAESLILEHVRHGAADVESWVCALNRGGPAFDQATALGAHTVLLAKGGGYARGLARLAGLMRRERITVAHGHNPTGGLYAAVAARLAGVPCVIRTEHSIHYPGRHSMVYERVLEPLATRLTHRVICVCEAARASHASRYGWAPAKFVTIPNGISARPAVRGRDVVRAELGLEPGHRLVLTVGSLTKQKAQHALIDAFAPIATAVPAARLALAGDGPLRSELEDRARGLGIAERVLFLGPRNDVADLMEGADLFVLSSVREGLSVTLLEAMRAGRPAVVTRVGGNAEAVIDRVNGLVVPGGDTPALSAAMQELLADPARAAACGAAGRELWARRFTAERMVGDTEALYRAILGRSEPVPAGVANPRSSSA